MIDDFSSDDSFESDELSSSSEDDLVELEEVLLGQHPRKKNENYLVEIVPQYTDEVFVEHFRVNRNSVEYITNRFSESIYFNQYAGQFGKLSARDQVCIYLWFVGHQTASFRDVADRFDVTISTLHRIVRRLSYFLSNQSNNMITWPNEEEKIQIEQHFRQNGFPGVLGVIDGTHIKIDKPSQDPDSYINRKGYFSIQMQLVCDHTMRVRDVFVGYPGSVHDSRVFRTSPLNNTLEEKCNNLYILGDSGYPLLNNLITPFKNRGQLTRQQIRYNTILSRNRVIIEHTIGILKQRFRQLFHLKLRNMRDMVHLIRACVVLHNICLGDNLNFNQEILVEPLQENVENDDIEDIEDRNAIAIRNHIVNIL